MGFSSLVLLFFPLALHFFLMNRSNCDFSPWLFFVDKRHVAPTLNLVNVVDLNKVLRSEVFMSEDRQLRAVHLILDFEPLSDTFQDVGCTIRTGS